MNAARALVVDLSKIDKNDLPLVGGKGANLGEMIKAGFPVPPGFAVTVTSYDLFLDENNLRGEIAEILKGYDRKSPEELAWASTKIQNRIKKARVPADVAHDIISSYKKLSGRFKKVYVAARSSATAEDLPSASFAGQQATFLNVVGEATLVEKVKECWASLFTARAIFYREENKIVHEKVKISVIVQKMIQSEVSGVMFSIDPVTNDKDRIIVESVWGLGEMIVGGQVVPDRYVVQKETFAILFKEISDQKTQLIRKGTETIETDVPKKIIDKQKISDEEIVVLAKLANKLQEHYYFPQDIEWAKEGKNLYIVQTRPITTIKTAKQQKEAEGQDVKTSAQPILRGQAASPGIGTGRVVILKSPREIGKVKEGDVLVAEMTSPDYVPAMKKAVAIVTNQGGSTSHAAIVSRELGVPCVVGTKEATSVLKENFVVSVDGTNGVVYLGSQLTSKTDKTEKVKKRSTKLKTATRVYVNLAEAERVSEIAKKNVDGVGLLRAEFMIANINMHPKEAIYLKKQDIFVKKLTSELTKFCKAFNPRPIVYRATDFKTNEYRALPGGKRWEPEESNPMLGFRGAYRYIAQPDAFNLELMAIKNVREKYKNLHMMVPFVRSPEELKKVRRLIESQGLFDSATFKLWMMVELPVNVIKLSSFIDVGIDGVSIGSNDLTMLLLGTDRDNSEVASAFNERSEVVYWALRRVIKTCHKYNISSSICGQAPSTYDDLVQKLVKWGITSISVNPDAIDRVREVVFEKEREILNGKNS